ncbi:MAG: BON domain-containing protein, partial [Acidobacteria bacterium]|nr:BON domain-containing protein [Acidobacteriota bacterium]
WAGRSNFETGFTGWGPNRYDRNSYDPYWTSDVGNDYERDRENDHGRHWWNKAADEVASWFGDDEAERRRQMDYRREGDFRGRGPRGYTRSDDRIKEDLSDRLTDDYALDASEIDVDVTNGEVVLSGTVESRYEKRRAEDVAEAVSGVRNVENRLRVKEYEYPERDLRSTGYGTDRVDPDYLSGGTEERSRGVGGAT